LETLRPFPCAPALKHSHHPGAKWYAKNAARARKRVERVSVLIEGNRKQGEALLANEHHPSRDGHFSLTDRTSDPILVEIEGLFIATRCR
jgi:hypothetical protein